MPDVEWFLLTLSPAGIVAAAAAIAALFGPRFLLGILSVPADEVRSNLARRLRLAGYRSTDRPAGPSVRIGRTTVVKLTVDSTPAGTRVRWQAALTPIGWAWLAVLLLLSWFVFFTAFVAIPFAVYHFLRARGFAKRAVGGRFLPAVQLPPAPMRNQADELLLAALADFHRLAAEAYDALLPLAWGLVGLTLLAGIAASTVLRGVLMAPPFSLPFDVSFDLSLVLIPISAIPGVLIYRHYRPRLHESRRAVERLRDALLDEESGRAGENRESTFELVLEMSRKGPGWLRQVQRSGLDFDPGLLVLTLVLAVFATYFVVVAATLAVLGSAWFLGAAAAAVALVLAAIGAVLYRRLWARRQAEEEQEKAEWEARFARHREEMERYLEGL